MPPGSPRTSLWLAAATCLASFGRAQTTSLVSLGSGGALGNDASLGPGAIAAGGRFVAYSSNASNLVPGDTNFHVDAFLHDRQTGITTRVSVSSAGAQGDDASGDPRPSADGRFVAFTATSANLVAGDTNLRDDIFVRDTLNATTVRVSLASGGTQANGHSYFPAISADGRFVTFMSEASNLVVGDANVSDDVFVHDLQTGQTQRASVDSSGAEGNSFSTNASLSADGRYVVFASEASNLVAGDTNAKSDVFVRDLSSGLTTRVSVDSSGAQGNDQSSVGIQLPGISGDGRYVGFASHATNLVPGDTNGKLDVFVHDRVTGTTERVSVSSLGVQGNNSSMHAAFSFDGRYVAFASAATNLVLGDTNARNDVFVRDRVSGQTLRASLGPAGAQGNGHSGPSLPLSITADGRTVAFDSGASNLVLGDSNGQWDVFVSDLWPAGPSSYCTPGTSSNGCTATISGTAEPRVGHASACSLSVAGVDGQRSGILFYALTALIQPWCGTGGGSSFLCVKPPTQRSAPQSSGGTAGACDGSLALDWSAYQIANPAALGNPWSAGSQAFVQAWFRDPPSCKTTSLSDALVLTYQP